jgi:TolB-like protein/Tfp pilus assembly protein PilF
VKGENQGLEGSSEVVSEPPAASVAAGSPTVFLSYASPDTEIANQVCQFLEAHGVACWMAPRDVKPGAAYADAIVRAINEASALVLVLSANAMASEHVSREVERAASKHKPVVAFRVDAARLSAELEYFLSRSQWIDVPALGMSGALAKLAEAVGRGSASAQPNPGLGGGKASGSINQALGTATVAKRVVVAAAVVIVLSVGGVLAALFWQSKHGEAQAPAVATISDKSIAVLPFADMSQKKDQEYFADGMAEEILDLLAKVPGLHVPARTSSFYFKGKSEDIPTIARRLNVGHVLEGSVRRDGDRVRITVQLINADNGYHLWSETYDRTLDDIFKVQDEIAGEIVKALKVSLGEKELSRVVATTSSEAHALLLQARFFAARSTREDLSRAIAYYEKVIQLDPDSAVAWAELSMALTYVWNSGFLPKDRTVQQQRTLALQAAERAIAINLNLAAAHEALAEIRFWFDWDWSSADVEVNKARALDPSSTTALTQAGALAMLRGRSNVALGFWEQASTQDPLNSEAQQYLAEGHFVLGQFTEAEVAARKAVDLNPMMPASHLPLGRALLALGRQDAALAAIEKEPDPGYRAFALARAYIVLARQADADAAVSQLKKNFAAEQPYNIATLFALRGERDQAFAWLDLAYLQRHPSLIGIPPLTAEPDLQNLRGDPRYKAFLKKMNLPE